MKKEFNVKGFNVRSFMVSGLTAKWGIGSPRDESYKMPLHAWTIKGRADGSTDFTPLPDITGAGVAMSLAGFTGTEGSGFEGGYLSFSGTSESAKTVGFTIDKDWTVVGEWAFTGYKKATAGISKPSSFRVYNRVRAGMDVFINTSGSALKIQGGHLTTKAFCSDGRVYVENGEKLINNNPQTVTGSNNPIIVGANGPGTARVSMKFKNLAIYDRVLSESQCKKAYDWLQTQ